MSSLDIPSVEGMVRPQDVVPEAVCRIDSDNRKCHLCDHLPLLLGPAQEAKVQAWGCTATRKGSNNIHHSCKTAHYNTSRISHKTPSDPRNFLPTPRTSCTTFLSRPSSQRPTIRYSNISHGNLQRSKFSPTSLAFHNTSVPPSQPARLEQCHSNSRRRRFSSR